MTTRGFGEADFERVANYVHEAIGLCGVVQKGLPKDANKLKDFKAKVAGGEVEEIERLRAEIAGWAGTFPLPV